jgi:hypothetical protein
MKENKTFKLPPAQQRIVDQKLKEANEYLRTADLSILFQRKSKPENTTKS